jgi:hypothetical protein
MPKTIKNNVLWDLYVSSPELTLSKLREALTQARDCADPKSGHQKQKLTLLPAVLNMVLQLMPESLLDILTLGPKSLSAHPAYENALAVELPYHGGEKHVLLGTNDYRCCPLLALALFLETRDDLPREGEDLLFALPDLITPQALNAFVMDHLENAFGESHLWFKSFDNYAAMVAERKGVDKKKLKARRSWKSKSAETFNLKADVEVAAALAVHGPVEYVIDKEDISRVTDDWICANIVPNSVAAGIDHRVAAVLGRTLIFAALTSGPDVLLDDDLRGDIVVECTKRRFSALNPIETQSFSFSSRSTTKPGKTVSNKLTQKSISRITSVSDHVRDKTPKRGEGPEKPRKAEGNPSSRTASGDKNEKSRTVVTNEEAEDARAKKKAPPDEGEESTLTAKGKKTSSSKLAPKVRKRSASVDDPDVVKEDPKLNRAEEKPKSSSSQTESADNKGEGNTQQVPKPAKKKAKTTKTTLATGAVDVARKEAVAMNSVDREFGARKTEEATTIEKSHPKRPAEGDSKGKNEKKARKEGSVEVASSEMDKLLVVRDELLKNLDEVVKVFASLKSVVASLGSIDGTTNMVSKAKISHHSKARSQPADSSEEVHKDDDHVSRKQGATRAPPQTFTHGKTKTPYPSEDNQSKRADGDDDAVRKAPSVARILPANLSNRPRSLEKLWEEYTNGLGGNKPAESFTDQEKKSPSVRSAYSLRSGYWEAMIKLLAVKTKDGMTPQAARSEIEKCYFPGQKQVPVGKMLDVIYVDQHKGFEKLNKVIRALESVGRKDG